MEKRTSLVIVQLIHRLMQTDIRCTTTARLFYFPLLVYYIACECQVHVNIITLAHRPTNFKIDSLTILSDTTFLNFSNFTTVSCFRIGVRPLQATRYRLLAVEGLRFDLVAAERSYQGRFPAPRGRLQ